MASSRHMSEASCDQQFGNWKTQRSQRQSRMCMVEHLPRRSMRTGCEDARWPRRRKSSDTRYREDTNRASWAKQMNRSSCLMS